ncbi:MAG TPA: hypothetical protein VE865_03540 [Bradyrhizobium sp.]|nr:hypothetical protein [Bradyrhizobium sp.]
MFAPHFLLCGDNDYRSRIVRYYQAAAQPFPPYRMETGGYTQADLGRLLGSRQRASDILVASLQMIWMIQTKPAKACAARGFFFFEFG